MDFSRLPKTAFLKIFEYLQLEVYFRAGRVNKTFRQIGQLAISRTKYLDLGEDRFRNLTPDQLAVILDLCASNLERFKIRGEIGDDDHWKQLAITLANFEYPRLVDIDLGETPIDHAIFEQLIRNCPNMESLVWQKECVGFPAMTNNNLKKLCVHVSCDAGLQTLIGYCPNLEQLILFEYGITTGLLDQFIGSIPHVHQIIIIFRSMDAVDFEEAAMVNFYKLPLTELRIRFSSEDSAGDDLLRKVATSFPHLRELYIGELEPTNQAIAWLAALRDLQVLYLVLSENGEPYDEGISQLAHCKNLRRLDVFQSNMTGGTLVNLVRSCPRLEYVKFWYITDVDTSDEAVVILESLAGIPKRDISINWFYVSEKFESIWNGEAAKAVIKKLEEDEGLKIDIVGNYY